MWQGLPLHGPWLSFPINHTDAFLSGCAKITINLWPILDTHSAITLVTICHVSRGPAWHLSWMCPHKTWLQFPHFMWAVSSLLVAAWQQPPAGQSRKNIKTEDFSPGHSGGLFSGDPQPYALIPNYFPKCFSTTACVKQWNHFKFSTFQKWEV